MKNNVYQCNPQFLILYKSGVYGGQNYRRVVMSTPKAPRKFAGDDILAFFSEI